MPNPQALPAQHALSHPAMPELRRRLLSGLPGGGVSPTVSNHDGLSGTNMADLTIYLGNRNYASWSLRAWLALKATGAPFEEVVIPLFTPGSKETLLKYSPTGKVPALHHGDVAVWDSLAICGYLAEVFPEAGLWPAD